VEKTTSRGALWSVLFSKYYSGDQIKKNEMGRACGMHRVLVERPERRNHFAELGIEGEKLLKWIFRNWDG